MTMFIYYSVYFLGNLESFEDPKVYGETEPFIIITLSDDTLY